MERRLFFPGLERSVDFENFIKKGLPEGTRFLRDRSLLLLAELGDSTMLVFAFISVVEVISRKDRFAVVERRH
jgi:hypothetical protein